MSKGQPLEGDHSAFNDTDHPTKHSQGIRDSIPRIHVPWPAVLGQAPVSDGSKYVATTVVTQLNLTNLITANDRIMTIFTVDGDLTVETSRLRIYNKYASNRKIKEVFASVNTAPTGASIILDVLINGTSIFAAEGDKPTITASSYTDTTTTIQTNLWTLGDYFLFEIEQIGSTIPGADLVLQIIHDPIVGASGSKIAFLKGSVNTTGSKIAYLQGA